MKLFVRLLKASYLPLFQQVRNIQFTTGAGSTNRQSLGMAIFGGMLVATVLALLVVPVLYVAIDQVQHLHTH